MTGAMSSEICIEGVKLILKEQDKEEQNDSEQSVAVIPRIEIRSVLISNERLLVQLDKTLIADAFDMPYSPDSDLNALLMAEESLVGGPQEDSLPVRSYDNPEQICASISWPSADWSEAYCGTSREFSFVNSTPPVKDVDVSGEATILNNHSNKLEKILNKLDNLLM
jgi:hypothetical protein